MPVVTNGAKGKLPVQLRPSFLVERIQFINQREANILSSRYSYHLQILRQLAVDLF